MSKPSDKAIAAAFWEIWDSPEYDNVTDGIYLRAEQIDATAAPVVVGEDAVGRALCAKVPGAWGGTGEWSVTAFINTPSPLFPDLTPRDIIRAALTAALAGD